MNAGANVFSYLATQQLLPGLGTTTPLPIAESSGIAVIDSRSCAVVTYKARFEPATGRDGKPAKSVYEQSITWRVTD